MNFENPNPLIIDNCPVGAKELDRGVKIIRERGSSSERVSASADATVAHIQEAVMKRSSSEESVKLIKEANHHHVAHAEAANLSEIFSDTVSRAVHSKLHNEIYKFEKELRQAIVDNKEEIQLHERKIAELQAKISRLQEEIDKVDNLDLLTQLKEKKDFLETRENEYNMELTNLERKSALEQAYLKKVDSQVEGKINFREIKEEVKKYKKIFKEEVKPILEQSISQTEAEIQELQAFKANIIAKSLSHDSEIINKQVRSLETCLAVCSLTKAKCQKRCDSPANTILWARANSALERDLDAMKITAAGMAPLKSNADSLAVFIESYHKEFLPENTKALTLKNTAGINKSQNVLNKAANLKHFEENYGSENAEKLNAAYSDLNELYRKRGTHAMEYLKTAQDFMDLLQDPQLDYKSKLAKDVYTKSDAKM